MPTTLTRVTSPIFWVELDWAAELASTSALEAEEELLDGVVNDPNSVAAGLTYKVGVVTLSGPAGGWPVLRFEADEANMRELILRYTEAPEEVQHFWDACIELVV